MNEDSSQKWVEFSAYKPNYEVGSSSQLKISFKSKLNLFRV